MVVKLVGSQFCSFNCMSHKYHVQQSKPALLLVSSWSSIPIVALTVKREIVEVENMLYRWEQLRRRVYRTDRSIFFTERLCSQQTPSIENRFPSCLATTKNTSVPRTACCLRKFFIAEKDLFPSKLAEVFPIVETKSLTGEVAKFPAILKDRVSIVAVFHRKVGLDMFKTWMGPFEEAMGPAPGEGDRCFAV